MGLVNGTVAPLAGYSAANAGIKGQEAGAVAGAKMPYDIATDRARQVTGAQLEDGLIRALDPVVIERDSGLLRVVAAALVRPWEARGSSTRCGARSPVQRRRPWRCRTAGTS